MSTTIGEIYAVSTKDNKIVYIIKRDDEVYYLQKNIGQVFYASVSTFNKHYTTDRISPVNFASIMEAQFPREAL